MNILSWLISEKSVEQIYTSAIICFDCSGKDYPNPLNGEESLPLSQRHITLLFLGDVQESLKEECLARIINFSKNNTPITGKFTGYGIFNREDSGSPVVVLFDSVELTQFRCKLSDLFDGISVKQNHGFIPHMTLGYTNSNNILIPLDINGLEVTFNSISLWWGNEKYSFDLINSGG